MPWQFPFPCWVDLLRETQMHCCTPHPDWASFFVFFFNVNCNLTLVAGWAPAASPARPAALSPACWHSSPSSLLSGPPPLQGNKRAQGGAAGLLACPEQQGKDSSSLPPDQYTFSTSHTGAWNSRLSQSGLSQALLLPSPLSGTGFHQQLSSSPLLSLEKTS